MKRRALALRSSGLLGLILLFLCSASLWLPLSASAQSGLDILSLTSSAVANENGWSNDQSITFSWTVADPATVAGYSYELGDGPLIPDEVIEAADAATVEAGWSAPQSRWFSVRACGIAGGWGPPVSLEVKNDSGVPLPWHININDYPEQSGQYRFLWYNADITEVWGDYRFETYMGSPIWYEELSVDGGPFAAEYLIPASPDHSNDGIHHCVYRGVDEAGNVGDYPIDIGIDTTAPTINVVGADDSWHPDGEIEVAFTDALSGVYYIEALLDGQTFALGRNETEIVRDPFPDGVHVLTLTAYDDARPEWNATLPTDFTLKCDSTPPETVLSGGDDAWHGDSVPLFFAASDSLAGLDYTESRVDRGDWTRGAERTILAEPDHSNDGVHEAEYRSVDVAGNTEPTKTCQVKIDTTAPRATVPERQSSRDSFTLTLSDALSPTCSVRVRILKTAGRKMGATAKGGRRTKAVVHFTVELPCRDAPQRVPLPPGLHARPYLLVVTATDLAGNRQAEAVTGVLRVK